MNLRTYNLPPGVSLSDLDREEDLDGVIEQLNQRADAAHERAVEAQIQEQIDSARKSQGEQHMNKTK